MKKIELRFDGNANFHLFYKLPNWTDSIVLLTFSVLFSLSSFPSSVIVCNIFRIFFPHSPKDGLGTSTQMPNQDLTPITHNSEGIVPFNLVSLLSSMEGNLGSWKSLGDAAS